MTFAWFGLSGGARGPTLPGLAARVGESLAEIGLVTFASAFGSMIGTLLAGRLLDRGHGRAMVAVAAVGAVVPLALIPSVRSLPVLLILFALLGVAGGFIGTGGQTLLVWTDERRASTRISAMHFFFGAGAVIGPLTVAWSFPLRGDGLAVYWAFAAMAIPLAWMLWRAGSGVSVPQHAIPSETRSASRRSFLWFGALFFLFVGAERIISSWLFAHAMEIGVFDASQAAYLNSGFWTAFTMARLVSIPLSRTVSPRRFVGLSVAACAVSSLALFIVGSTFTGLWVVTIVFGASIATIFPQTASWLNDAIGTTGRRMSWIILASSVGSMLFPWGTGLLMERFSGIGLPLALTAACLAGVVGYVVLVRRMRGAEYPA